MLRIRGGIWGFCLVLVFLFWCGETQAGQLVERLASFPNWESKLSVQVAKGDLVYPDWMTGTWNVTSTLVEMVAPLAPDVVTPGFESNRRYLEQPVTFTVRFVKQVSVPSFKLIPQLGGGQAVVVADRGFNGLNLVRAYLGDKGAVLSVKVDPDSPNRQITLLRGERQLVSIVTGRATETPQEGKFITIEVFQQLFRSPSSPPYFNQVESTTAYQHLSTTSPSVEAEQITAVYLSPQDSDFFAAGSRPVALYRYRLEFFPV